jgi:hypothetical protein
MGNQKTTVYLDPDDYRSLKSLAKARGVAPAMLVREAVAEYNTRHSARRPPTSIGSGRSRTGNVAERAEELLEGMGKSR